MNAAPAAALSIAMPAVNMAVVNAVGYLAAVCTTVACPHCGGGQAW